LALLAIKNDYNSIAFMPDSIKANKIIIVTAVRICGTALYYAAP
jgi:hypothetical protein